MNKDKILLAHGEGGLATKRLIEQVFSPFLSNEILDRREDSAVVSISGKKYSITTDGFVVDPIFFPGGNIGSLAVSGTINDLSAMGAKPLWFSASFIIEEGLSLESLEKISRSISDELAKYDAMIITADTKVVPHGQGGEIFIIMTGIGEVVVECNPQKIVPGDEIVISGDIARHSAAILCARENIEADPPLLSDCMSLWNIVNAVIENGIEIHAMRDPTRGGLATTLVEISEQAHIAINLDEKAIPVLPQVGTLCDLYGFDPLYLANEGKMIFFVANGCGQKLIDLLRTIDGCEKASVIGRTSQGKGVILDTITGGRRKLIMLEGEQLPRIC